MKFSLPFTFNTQTSMHIFRNVFHEFPEALSGEFVFNIQKFL